MIYDGKPPEQEGVTSRGHAAVSAAQSAQGELECAARAAHEGGARGQATTGAGRGRAALASVPLDELVEAAGPVPPVFLDSPAK